MSAIDFRVMKSFIFLLVLVGLFSLISLADQDNSQPTPEERIDKVFNDSLIRFAEDLCGIRADYFHSCYGMTLGECPQILSEVSQRCESDMNDYETISGVTYSYLAKGITNGIEICLDVNLVNEAIADERAFGSDCSE